MFPLQNLFDTPIVRQTLFAEIHPGQASFVWSVETEDEDVIVRTSRLDKVQENNFWWGCRVLFGIKPAEVHTMAPMNDLLATYSPIPVPRVLRRAHIDGKQFVVVEKMAGETLTSFQRLPVQALHEFGVGLAHLHRVHFNECGNLCGSVRYPVSEWGERLAMAMEGLVQRFYRDHDLKHVGIVRDLDEMMHVARNIPLPSHASLIMLDIDPTQYLTDGHRITALVDTEVYALGPKELELVALEYLLDRERAAAFKTGYETLIPFPDLTPVRRLYRYFGRLIEIQGSVDYDKWMNWPIRF